LLSGTCIRITTTLVSTGEIFGGWLYTTDSIPKYYSFSLLVKNSENLFTGTHTPGEIIIQTESNLFEDINNH